MEGPTPPAPPAKEGCSHPAPDRGTGLSAPPPGVHWGLAQWGTKGAKEPSTALLKAPDLRAGGDMQLPQGVKVWLWVCERREYARAASLFHSLPCNGLGMLITS